MSRHKFSISAIVPVHHQASLIESAVSKIDLLLRSNNFDYEIILIDSGGDDGSSEKCDTLAKANVNIRVIHDPVHTKFGAKMKIGYQEAKKDLIWPVVLDLPFPLEKILEAEPLLDKYDAVLSYRLNDPRGWTRKLQSHMYNLIIRLLLGIKVRHVNSAFRVYKKQIIKSFPLLQSDGWFIDAEVIYYIIKMRLSYVEIPTPVTIDPVHYSDSSVGMLTFIQVTKEMFYFLMNKKI